MEFPYTRCSLICNANKFSASVFAQLKSLQMILYEWNDSLRVSPGPHWGVYLRRVTQTESEHKTCWAAVTWLAILLLVATLEHKNLVWRLTAFVFSKSATSGPAPIDLLSWTLVKSVRSSLWSLKTDAENWPLVEPGNGRFLFAFPIELRRSVWEFYWCTIIYKLCVEHYPVTLRSLPG